MLDMFVRSGGQIIATRQVRSSRVQCPMDTFRFPFDEQVCKVLIYDRTPVKLKADDIYRRIDLNKNNILSGGVGEWSIAGFHPVGSGLVRRMHELTTNESIDAVTEKVAGVLYAIRMKRNALGHVFAW